MAVNLYCNDGFGGCLSTYGAAKLLRKRSVFSPSEEIKCFFSCSDPVYELLKFFSPHFIRKIEKVEETWYDTNGADKDTFNLTPNLFDKDKKFYSATGINWRQIKCEKGIERFASGNKICLAFATSQPNNSYPFINDLILYLLRHLPDHQFYFPLVKNWGGKEGLVYNIDVDKLAGFKNLTIQEPTDIVSDYLKIATECKYFIGVDNGMMNFAWHIDAERMLIDCRANPTFNIRWRQTMDDSVSSTHHFLSIGKAFVNMVQNPFLCAVKKEWLVQRGDSIFADIGH